MMHAYDKSLINRACDSLGRMLDFAVHSLNIEAERMMMLFTASNTARLFECGDIRIILGMSGIELAYQSLDRSGVHYERSAPKRMLISSSEYWCGRALAYAQWTTSLGFDELLKLLPVSTLIEDHNKQKLHLLDSMPFDISSSDREAAIMELGESFVAASVSEIADRTASDGKPAKDTRLKKARIKSGLSQSMLAETSGIPLRTIQQYEQRQKDINRARAEYLIMLSTALNCDPSSLLERD